MTTTTTREYWATRYRVDLPDGERGDVRVGHFTIEPDNIHNALAAIKHGRGTTPGTYTAIYRRGDLWMSDTDAEVRDHLGMIRRIEWQGGRFLIMGLGLGMIVKAALAVPTLTHVDVVEIDPDVAALVGPHYEADPRCTVHVGDAYDITWPRGTRWDLAWYDIWQDVSGENQEGITRLKRRYGRKVGYQEAWAEGLVRSANARDRSWSNRYGW